jgi:hypothetical protein
MASCVGSVEKTSVVGDSQLHVPDWNNALASWLCVPEITNSWIALMPDSCTNANRKGAGTRLRFEPLYKFLREINQGNQSPLAAAI